MARPLRIEYPYALYHISSRGNAAADIYLDNKDREIFFELLEALMLRYKFNIYAYCLMDNHYHLLIQTRLANLSEGMRMLNGLYTQHFNRRHQRVGHLFQGRYKSFIIEKESYLLEVCRYIELNPIRSRLAKRLGEWEWSSYRSIVGIEEPRNFLAVNEILSLFSSNKLNARKQYIQFVESKLDNKDLYENSHGGMILGSERFARQVMEKVKDKNSREFIKKERDAGRPKLNSILKGRDRDGEILTAVIQWNYKQKEVADFLDLHYSTVSKIVKENSKIKT